jgi:hypothetical protein
MLIHAPHRCNRARKEDRSKQEPTTPSSENNVHHQNSTTNIVGNECDDNAVNECCEGLSPNKRERVWVGDKYYENECVADYLCRLNLKIVVGWLVGCNVVVYKCKCVAWRRRELHEGLRGEIASVGRGCLRVSIS